MLELSDTANKKTNPWGFLAIATGAQISTSFIIFATASIMPFLVDSLKLTAAEAGLAGGAVNVGMIALALPAGYLADRYGEKKVLVPGCLLTGLSIMVASRMQVFSWFYILLLFTGLWAAAVTPAGSKIITNWFPARRLGFAQSVRQTGVTIGGFFAAILLPPLAARANWHVALLLSGLTGVLGGLAVLLFYQGGATPAPTPSRRPVGWGALANRNIWLTCSMGMLFVGGQFILLSYLQLFLMADLLVPAAWTARFLALMILSGVAGRVFWGFVSDSLFHGQRRPVLITTGFSATVASLSMLMLGPTTPVVITAVLICLLGFVALGWNGVYITLLSELADGKNEAATAVGIGVSVMQLGVLLLPPLFGYMVDVTHTYRDSWLFMAAVMLFGLILVSRVREKKTNGKGV